MQYWLQTLSDMLGWHKTNWGLDSVSQVLPAVFTLNLLRCVGLSRDLCTISRPDRAWGLDFVYQVTHALQPFAGYVGLTKKLHHWGHHGGHVTWLQFKDQEQKWEQDLLGFL